MACHKKCPAKKSILEKRLGEKFLVRKMSSHTNLLTIIFCFTKIYPFLHSCLIPIKTFVYLFHFCMYKHVCIYYGATFVLFTFCLRHPLSLVLLVISHHPSVVPFTQTIATNYFDMKMKFISKCCCGGKHQ